MAYLNVTELESALQNLAAAYPATTELIAAPNLTHEGRQTHILRVGTSNDPAVDGVLILGGVHAREWVPPDALVSLAADLLEAYQLGTGLGYGGKTFASNEVREIVETLNLFFYACVNPDGRQHSQTNEALWRKNRRPDPRGGSCVGVDLNRNFDFLWDHLAKFAANSGVSASADPCHPSVYRGPSPTSEPETKNVVWLLDTYPGIRWHVDVHSSVPVILHSWGSDENQTTAPVQTFLNNTFDGVRGRANDVAYGEFITQGDLDIVAAVSTQMNDAVKAVRGDDYGVEQAFGLYPTSGASDDYAFSRHFTNSAKAKVYGFTVECGHSFQPTWSEAENVIREVSSGLIALYLAASASAISSMDRLHWSLIGQSAGFGNLLDGQHPIWIADFTGAGRAQVLFYYSGDGSWWLGDMVGGQLQWSLASQSAGFGNLLDGQHPIWIADFTGAGRAQVMFYYSGDGSWWLGDMVGGQLQWSLASQSAGFGNLLDGQHPIWIADFTGAGQAQVMFYYSGDGNWWLGDMVGGQLQWSLASQSAGFGNLLDGQHPIWIADFTGAGRAQVLFYYSGDGNWWLGDMVGGQLQWSLASQSAGFGNLLDGQHPIWIADFTGAGRAQVMFYYSGDGSWWLGDMVGGQLQWSLVSQSAGFGNLLDGQHPIWIADFTGVGHAQVMFYYSGDGNWWLGDMVGGQLQWSLASQSAGFGNLLDGQHPIWIADFTGAGRAQVMFYYSGDGNWWLGDMVGGQLQWSLVSHSRGFGNLLDGQHPIWIADFTGVGHAQVMFYYSGDGHWWLGNL